MKMFNNLTPALKIMLLAMAVALAVSGCSKTDPIASSSGNEERLSARKELNFLEFSNGQQALGKKEVVKKKITRANGGSLKLTHGLPNGTAGNLMYGNSKSAPFNIYKIDPENLSGTEVVGQLAFSTKAIALHPISGLLYYVGHIKSDGVYPVGVWDPRTNTNTILPGGTSFRPADKLAFRQDGTLFGVNKTNTKKIYQIDTETGAWTLHSMLNKRLGNAGDIAFNPNGILFNVNGRSGRLQRVNLATNSVSNAGSIGVTKISGICFSNKGRFFIVKNNGAFGLINTQNGIGQYLGNSGMGRIDDLAPVISHRELTYANISLDIPPNSISKDAEIEISIETTEIVGGVFVSFAPHGVVFDIPALLNITAYGVDFTGVNPQEVSIYYDNQESGLWEEMEREQIIINAQEGIVQVINAQIPHFSRYALSKD